MFDYKVGLFALIAVVFLSGCATSLTNSSPAKTYEAGKGQVAFTFEVDVHSQAFTGIYSAGRAAAAAITEEDDTQVASVEALRTILDAVLLWQLFPFSSGPEIMGRIGLYDGILEGIDFGFRYNGTVAKGDLRLQLWESPDSTQALSAQVSYGRHGSLFSSLLETVDLAEWSRHDFDFLLSFGAERGDWFRGYIAPRYLHSRVDTTILFGETIRARLPQEVRDLEPAEYFRPGGIHYMGANLGTMLGYRWIFLAVELTVMRVIFRPTVLGSTRNYDGWVVAPNASILVNW